MVPDQVNMVCGKPKQSWANEQILGKDSGCVTEVKGQQKQLWAWSWEDHSRAKCKYRAC